MLCLSGFELCSRWVPLISGLITAVDVLGDCRRSTFSLSRVVKFGKKEI